MIFIIALSAEIPLFKNERILDSLWASRFPGAEWMPSLADKLSRKGFRVTTVDVALSHVQQGYWDPEGIGVIQHLNDPEAETLIGLGGVPLVVTAFESPLYVPKFYHDVKQIVSKFSYRVLFSGLYDDLTHQQGNYQLRFPCYHEKDIQKLVAWDKRDFLVTVVANKYALPFSLRYLCHPLDALKWLKRVIWSLKILDFSIFLRVKKAKQLQDKRYSAICFFGEKDKLKLYGKGWETLKNLPFTYRRQLQSSFFKLKPEFCEEKIETLAHYKFSLCFENCSFPGYITEKIIDCFVAGVIPLYLGAPDIESFVPLESFIDVRKYKNWEELLDRLNFFTEREAQKMIQKGRDYLNSSEGKLHTFEGFASFVESLVVLETEN